MHLEEDCAKLKRELSQKENEWKKDKAVYE